MSDPANQARVWAAGEEVGTVEQIAATVLADPALRELAWRLDEVVLSPHELAPWARERLDSRRGGERQTARPSSLDGPAADAVLDAAWQLGITGSAAPSRSHYDYTLILGGTVLANTLRTAFARRLLADGTGLGVTVALGADRPLTPSELLVTGPRILTESQHLAATALNDFGLIDNAAMRTAAGMEAPADVLSTAPDGPLRLMSAPPSDLRRRADTHDAVRFFVSRTPDQERRRVLLVTSSMYMPYQLLVAAKVLLRAGTRTVEVVGTPALIEDRSRSAQVLGQEINGLVQAAARLLTADC